MHNTGGCACLQPLGGGTRDRGRLQAGSDSGTRRRLFRNRRRRLEGLVLAGALQLGATMAAGRLAARRLARAASAPGPGTARFESRGGVRALLGPSISGVSSSQAHSARDLRAVLADARTERRETRDASGCWLFPRSHLGRSRAVFLSNTLRACRLRVVVCAPGGRETRDVRCEKPSSASSNCTRTASTSTEATPVRRAGSASPRPGAFDLGFGARLCVHGAFRRA
ncbi:hypothetical protein C8F04DRAFT_1255707 [Mycena alexandri]|uniref:Uncharacterized protein n=1 Tax=Mycena alexandri TaxID=1745969 RepID=A0AAD6X8H4_9AGAR|nr:hypothetical protein C8F04DRAFT_1255707 [Mycena alexandri]